MSGRGIAKIGPAHPLAWELRELTEMVMDLGPDFPYEMHNHWALSCAIMWPTQHETIKGSAMHPYLPWKHPDEVAAAVLMQLRAFPEDVPKLRAALADAREYLERETALLAIRRQP